MQNSNYGINPVGPYYGPPQWLPPNIILTTSPDVAYALQNISIENTQLKNELKNHNLRKQAFTDVIALDGATYTMGCNGRPQMLMDTTVEVSIHYIPESPLPNAPFYLIKFNRGISITIPEEDFHKDSRLINCLQQNGINVKYLRTQKTTAILLRQVINKKMVKMRLPFYGGWSMCDSKAFYDVFLGFSTCPSKNELRPPSELAPQSPATMKVSIANFFPIFQIIRTHFFRQLLILLYHEAALHTLLEQLGYKFPLTYCIFSTDQNILSFFRKLLSWFHSSPINLNAPPNDFSFELLARKDQPLLINTGDRLDQAKKNAEVLESAMINGVVEWKNKRESTNLPLKAPITLISSSSSALICSPESIIIDLQSDDFCREQWLRYSDQVGQNQDYLTAFCGYTSNHIPELERSLKEGQSKALHLDKGQLTEECLQAFGIFIGLTDFLKDFFDCASPRQSPISGQNNELYNLIYKHLFQTSLKSDRTSIPDQFIDVSKALIQSKELQISPKRNCSPGWVKAVFYDDNYIYFTSSAITKICQAMTKSRPVILQALDESDMLCGSKSNASTFLTRVTVKSCHGVKDSQDVIKLHRDLFEAFGDPLFNDEEDTPNEP